MTSTLLPYPRPIIAIVGRPNVGKSTLFNRFVGWRKAVVSSVPGTTRDRVYGQAEWRGRTLTFIDTAGFDIAKADRLAETIHTHLQRALHEADALLLLCDAQQGLVPMDSMIMDSLRKTGKPVIVAANKADHRLVVPPEIFSLGVEPVFAISALHGRGVSALLDDLMLRVALPVPPLGEAGQTRPVSIAIVGRQNVGKSSLLNALLREERVIVSELPGTTRDAIDTHLTVNGESVVLIDTAGLRHRRKVKEVVDFFAMSRSLEALARCDVALVVLDGTQGITRDDQRIITRVLEAGCGAVLLVNKWDLVTGGNERRLKDAVAQAMRPAAHAPILAVCAKTGFQVPRSLTTALRVAHAMREGIAAGELLTWVRNAWAATPPPGIRGRSIQLTEARWQSGRPCQVAVFTKPAMQLPARYQRYLLNTLTSHPRLAGIPLRLIVNPRSLQRKRPSAISRASS